MRVQSRHTVYSDLFRNEAHGPKSGGGLRIGYSVGPVAHLSQDCFIPFLNIYTSNGESPFASKCPRLYAHIIKFRILLRYPSRMSSHDIMSEAGKY